MSTCLIKTPEYLTRLALSGVPEHIFHALSLIFMNKFGRLPNLDEIPNSNSTKYLANSIHLTKENSAKLSDIQAVTGASTILEANVIINDKHNDLEVEIIPLGETAIVDIKQRPSIYHVEENESVLIDPNPNMRVVFNNIANKLNNLYGIQINTIRNSDLKEFEGVPGVSTASAFIHNGNIYINGDIAKADAPIHEMTHLLLGSIRFKNPDLYFSLIELATKFENFNRTAMFYSGRANSDILEEVFVEEMGKYLAGMKSDINKLPENIKYELHYGMKRLLDSVLMGDYSVRSLNPETLYKMTLPELVKEVNSHLLEPTFFGSLDDAAQHRMLANVKEDLIKNGSLQEICE